MGGARGIIPAGAGRRPRRHSARHSGRDHPRGCGEKALRSSTSSSQSGSSPRVRGEASKNEEKACLQGIIPAGAGRSGTVAPAVEPLRDHPRGCGEKAKAAYEMGLEKGSSPRVRGEAEVTPDVAWRFGIIPAGAGRSPLSSPLAGAFWDHPRGCGEKLFHAPPKCAPPGSSPRVRGEAHVRHHGAIGVGIIPAGAGRSLWASCGILSLGDHPRGCGEKIVQRGAFSRFQGSSPRVRGEAINRAAASSLSGIIPAGAGRSGNANSTALKSWDHPRGCGEKQSKRAHLGV